MWDTFTCRIILNGIVVKVGCQRVFFPTADALRDALNDYIEDPHKSIKRWRDTPFQKITEDCLRPSDTVGSMEPVAQAVSVPDEQTVSTAYVPR
jgi:hypothetical protein